VNDTSFTESVVEEAALAWLESVGWSVKNGLDIAPDMPDAERGDYGQVILERRLRDALARRFRRKGSRGLQVSVVSFGFRYGIPAEADMVVDVRFLPNPNFVSDLKEHSGLDRRVREYVFDGRIARSFMRRLAGMLHFLLPLYRKEGKAYFTLAVGCTGGRHRSVAVAVAIGNILRKKDESVVVAHRDLARSSRSARGGR